MLFSIKYDSTVFTNKIAESVNKNFVQTNNVSEIMGETALTCDCRCEKHAYNPEQHRL